MTGWLNSPHSMGYDNIQVDENISQTSQLLPDMMPVEMWAGMICFIPH